MKAAVKSMNLLDMRSRRDLVKAVGGREEQIIGDGKWTKVKGSPQVVVKRLFKMKDRN